MASRRLRAALVAAAAKGRSLPRSPEFTHFSVSTSSRALSAGAARGPSRLSGQGAAPCGDGRIRREVSRPVSLERRVVRVAEATLAERSHVNAIDVLLGLGWLHPRRVDDWRQGRVDCLERAVTVDMEKLSEAIGLFQSFARARGLLPSKTDYVARTRDRRGLRFSVGGDAEVERAYRTHWVSPELPERGRERLRERQSRPPELVVVSPLREWTCAGCGGTGDLLLMEQAGPICMCCADLDHLVFLAAGDAALTRRARQGSRLSAVVVRFSRARRRYERQGILVEEEALEHAERECLADAEARVRRREREAARREAEDVELHERMARGIERLYPGCPRGRAEAIARHTGTRGSGRVGRSEAGRALQPAAIALAVAASVRHEDTRYDELLMAGVDRAEAREYVRTEVERILIQWQKTPAAEVVGRTRPRPRS
jgi:hypothetical protein